MFARLALQSDEDRVVELAGMQVAETLPHLSIDEAVTRQTFQNYLKHGNPVIFVAEQFGDVCGFLMAMQYPYAFTSGHFTGQEVIYVRPDMRGTRASAKLFDLYDQWAGQIQAKEAYTGVANGRKIEKYSKYMARRGYTLVGMTFRRILRSTDG